MTSPAEVASKLSLSDPSLLKTKSFIAGKWTDASDAVTFDVRSPASGDFLATVPNLPRSQIKEAIAAANAAFPAWSALTAKERSSYLFKLLAIMKDNVDDLAKILTAENGKPFAEAKGEVAYSMDFVEWFAGEAVRQYGHTVASANPTIRNVVFKQPIGVAGLITPWNFPSAMITRKLAPALAAGCTMIIKAPAETPLSALAMAELVKRVGIPDGVVNVVTVAKGEREADCGLEICESEGVQKISFTGSTAVGSLLMKQSAGTIKKLSLELGGNAPLIVFDDCDIDTAVAGTIASKFRASGQTCVCANRIYVQAGIYEKFAAALAAKVSQFKIGDPMDPSTTHGPLIHAGAVKKVEAHVADAVARGARVLAGGKRGEGSFFEPTVLADVPADALCTKEETFGCVAPLIKFETEEEVIERANDTVFGLAGYFFSKDVNRCFRVGEALKVGMVGINSGAISQASIPFGGVKQSGFGREGGKSGIDEYTVDKLMVFGI